MRGLLFWILVGAVAGLLLEISDIHLSDWTVIGMIGVIVVVIAGYQTYILFGTKNVKAVEAYVKRRAKHPYYALTQALVEGDIEKAEQYAKQLKKAYAEVKKLARVNICIEKNELEEAARLANEIKNEAARYYNQALIALLRGQGEQFEHLKQKIKNNTFRYILEAERAFRKGEEKEAEQFGHLAISSARGLQRYVLVRSLERQRNHPNRRSFFSKDFEELLCDIDAIWNFNVFVFYGVIGMFRLSDDRTTPLSDKYICL